MGSIASASKLPQAYYCSVLEVPVAYFERIRDVVSEPFSSDVIRQRTAGGWQMVSIEWRRELPDSETPPDGAFSEAIPYGLRISEDCKRLEVDPHENQVLLLMMDLLAQDFSYSAIVSDLNEKGFRTREGRPWSRVAVFQHDAAPHRSRPTHFFERRVGAAPHQACPPRSAIKPVALGCRRLEWLDLGTLLLRSDPEIVLRLKTHPKAGVCTKSLRDAQGHVG